MTSIKKEDHRNIGLNADFAVSAYRMDNDHIIFDDENDYFSLCYMDENAPSSDEECNTLCIGTFEECVRYFDTIGEI